MLFIVGVGLGDENDVTAKGDAAIRASSVIFLEMYTSILAVSTDKLAAKYGKEIVIADREMVESRSDEILEPAKDGNVAFLVVGDALAATTHTDLALRAMDAGIEIRVIHNASIMNAVASCGLQLYKFGYTISIPFWTESQQPDSYFDRIMHNARGGYHTLCLLDIKVKEPDFEALVRGKKRFLPPRFMTVRQAAAILLEIGRRKRESGVETEVTTLNGGRLDCFQPSSRAVGVCRVGMATQLIVSATLEELAASDCGPPLHALVLVGETDEVEDSVIERLSIHGEPGRGPRPAPADAVGSLPEPPRAVLDSDFVASSSSSGGEATADAATDGSASSSSSSSATTTAAVPAWEIPPASDPREDEPTTTRGASKVAPPAADA